MYVNGVGQIIQPFKNDMEDEEEPDNIKVDVTTDEIEETLYSSRHRNPKGSDGISNELFKYGGSSLNDNCITFQENNRRKGFLNE